MEVGHHIVSLSLGTVAEPSALAVVQPRPERETHFDVVWLERFPAGRPIPAMVNRVMEIVEDKRKVRDYTLLLDITSTGRAPLRAFEARGIFAGAIDLTNAESEGYVSGVQRVPLRDVVGAAQVILQTARLQVASGLELASTLVTDLIGFSRWRVTWTCVAAGTPISSSRWPSPSGGATVSSGTMKCMTAMRPICGRTTSRIR